MREKYESLSLATLKELAKARGNERHFCIEEKPVD